jgi:hypothetical protein
MPDPDRPPPSCDRCAAELHPGRGDFYLVSIVAVADPSPPLIAEEDLARDVGREIDRLIKHLKGVDALEAMDQVYRRKVLYLCGPCYRHWIEDPTGA